MVTIKQIGCALKKARLDSGESQVSAGRAIQVHKNLISAIETGSQPPAMLTFIRLCEVYGVKPSEVFAAAEEQS